MAAWPLASEAQEAEADRIGELEARLNQLRKAELTACGAAFRR